MILLFIRACRPPYDTGSTSCHLLYKCLQASAPLSTLLLLWRGEIKAREGGKSGGGGISLTVILRLAMKLGRADFLQEVSCCIRCFAFIPLSFTFIQSYQSVPVVDTIHCWQICTHPHRQILFIYSCPAVGCCYRA